MLYSQPPLVQTAFVELSANVSTMSTSYVDLISCSMTTDANPVEIHFTACAGSTSAVDMGFQLVIDGNAVKGIRGRIGAAASPGHNTCASIRWETGRFTAGLHTVKIQWKTMAGLTTIQIRPATYIYEHCSLLLREVTI